MSKDRRTALRRGVTWTALMIDSAGRPVGECTIVDVSISGAKLVPSSAEPPAEFVLVLSKNGGVRRRCLVTWRRADSVGVRFIRPSRSEQAGASRFDRALALTAAARKANSLAAEADSPAQA